jgi:hypothetical protein
MKAAWGACRQRLIPALQRAGEAGGAALIDAVQRKLEVRGAAGLARWPLESRRRLNSGAGKGGGHWHPTLKLNPRRRGCCFTTTRLHVLTVEAETAEAEALLLGSSYGGVRAPPSGGWHNPVHAPALAAYAAAVAFESSCAIARAQLVGSLEKTVVPSLP